jgi:hypothetical protein
MSSQCARAVQGGRLKFYCVRTRGFKSHRWHLFFLFLNVVYPYCCCASPSLSISSIFVYTHVQVYGPYPNVQPKPHYSIPTLVLRMVHHVASAHYPYRLERKHRRLENTLRPRGCSLRKDILLGSTFLVFRLAIFTLRSTDACTWCASTCYPLACTCRVNQTPLFYIDLLCHDTELQNTKRFVFVFESVCLHIDWGH